VIGSFDFRERTGRERNVSDIFREPSGTNGNPREISGVVGKIRGASGKYGRCRESWGVSGKMRALPGNEVMSVKFSGNRWEKR
jgi:hypothetical protein